MTRRRRDLRPRAFTLLEVLLAIGLMLALLGAMFAFFWDMLSVRARIIEETDRRRAAATLIERVERDLTTCLVGDGVVGAGVSGDATSLRILSRGVPVHRIEAEGAAEAVLGDLEMTEYRFDERAGVITARRSTIVAGGEPDAEPDEEPDEESRFDLGGPVHRVRFRYHDGDGWRDAFDSRSADRLPSAVEIAVWFDPWPGEDAREPEDAIDAEPDSPTFDADAAFDERAFARTSDLDLFDEPRPDRIRVIAVPDAASPEAPALGAGP